MGCPVFSDPFDRLLDLMETIYVLGGDFNFVPTGEGRLQFEDAEAIHYNEPIAVSFEDYFDDFTDIAQDQYTRLHIEHQVVKSAARLDRIYINMHEVDIMDAQPRAAVLHNLHEANKLSDHAAISVALSAPSSTPPDGHFVPDCMLAHPSFSLTKSHRSHSCC